MAFCCLSNEQQMLPLSSVVLDDIKSGDVHIQFLHCDYIRSRDQDCKIPTLLLQTAVILQIGLFVSSLILQPRFCSSFCYPKLIITYRSYNGLPNQNAALIYSVSVPNHSTLAPEVANMILVMCC